MSNLFRHVNAQKKEWLRFTYKVRLRFTYKLKANKNVRADVFRRSTDLGKVSLRHLEVNTSEECQKSKRKVQQATSNILILL